MRTTPRKSFRKSVREGAGHGVCPRTILKRAGIASHKERGSSMKAIIALPTALYVAGVIWAHAGACAYPHPEPPPGCVIIGTTNPEDEGFPIAECKTAATSTQTL